MEKQIVLESNAEYEAFVDKFKPKLTTDDCYTPPEVYEVVKNWACAKPVTPGCKTRNARVQNQ